MPEAKPLTYQRLPGTGYKNLFPRWAVVLLFFAINLFVLFLRGRRVRLWTGPDHLLLVESDGFNEYYKRYFYRDIQGVVIRRTREAGIVNLVLGLMAVAVFFLLLGGTETADYIIFGLMLGFLVLFIIINVVKGPTCLCQLRTAVNTVTLPSLGRLRNAHRALARLRPLIAAAQGELTLTELQEKMQPPATPVPPAEPPMATVATPLDETDLPPRITS